MAITLNLKHTFTTRVVYSSELIAEIRQELRIGLSTNNIQDGRRDLAQKCLAGTDEELVLAMSKCGLRDNIRNELRSLFEDINVTRMGPLQTEVVG